MVRRIGFGNDTPREAPPERPKPDRVYTKPVAPGSKPAPAPAAPKPGGDLSNLAAPFAKIIFAIIFAINIDNHIIRFFIVVWAIKQALPILRALRKS